MVESPFYQNGGIFRCLSYRPYFRFFSFLGFFCFGCRWIVGVFLCDTAVEGLPGHFNAALPFTPDDLARYDFAFDEKRHAKPYIRGYMLPEIFGIYAGEGQAKYLKPIGNNAFCLREEVDNQQKINTLLGDIYDAKTQVIKEG